MWPFSRKKKKKQQEEKEVKTSAPVEEKKPVEAKKEPAKVEKKEEVKAPKKEEPKAEPKKVEKAEKEESSESSEEKKRTDTYHVSRRSKDGKWQVKFGGSDKPIKLFDTQAEALDYAKELSQKYDKSVSIHKRDGKIRKQKY
ncbi:MAG TPA: hypothetical protein DCY93_00885 [Firmicutes bacterium]|nr:hypothetical protein [Bacillota bacterium]